MVVHLLAKLKQDMSVQQLEKIVYVMKSPTTEELKVQNYVLMIVHQVGYQKIMICVLYVVMVS
jgi:uncharacterized protein YeeX (DUF496 family)